MNPPPVPNGLQLIAFICGCGHSGTTLVATILSMHPRIHVPLYESAIFLDGEDVARERLAQVMVGAVESRKPILVEKTPRHIRSMDMMRRLVPGARFIMLVRDGRDVTASIANRENGDFHVGFERWVNDNRLVLAERGKPDVCIARYEDVIADPAGEIERLCGFLGVEYRQEMLEYHKHPKLWYGKTEIRRVPGVGAENEDLPNWQVNQPIFDGRGRWKRDLPPAVVRQFDRGRALKLMRAFG